MMPIVSRISPLLRSNLAGEPMKWRFLWLSYGLTFPVWADPAEIAIDMFRNYSLPSSYLVDPDGRVRLAWSGAISMKMLEKYVTPLLDQ